MDESEEDKLINATSPVVPTNSLSAVLQNLHSLSQAGGELSISAATSLDGASVNDLLSAATTYVTTTSATDIAPEVASLGAVGGTAAHHVHRASMSL